MDEKPKIFLFNNTQQPGWGSCYSIAEDGTVIGQHICSHSGYMKFDLHDRPDRQKDCEAHYPGGYELVIVPDDEVKTHPGLTAALERNAEKARAEEQQNEHAT